jgi:hypothetical protein
MKKLLVLIILLVFGLSFVGVSNTFGEAVELAPSLWRLTEPNIPSNNCLVVVQVFNPIPEPPVNILTVIGGTCKKELDPPESPGRIAEIKIVDTKGKIIGSSTLTGWFYTHNSPGKYCYLHPVTNQYQCIYW